MINEADCGSYVPAGDVLALKQEVQRYAGLPEEERLKIGARGKEWLVANRSYSKLARQYIGIMLNKAAQV
jgi:hypothetical protein